MRSAAAGEPAVPYTCPTAIGETVDRGRIDRDALALAHSRDPRPFVVVRSGVVWEVRDADGVVSWAQTHDEAVAEAARHQRRR